MLKIFLPIISIIMLIPFFSKESKWSYSPFFLIILTLIYSTSSPLELPIFFKRIIFSDLITNSLILLTLWISSIIIIARNIILLRKDKPKMFLFITLSLTLILITAFSSRNIFIFFIFFEASLIPTIILILGWGYQPERLQASVYFLMYTLTARLPLLIIIAKIFFDNNNLNINICSMLNISFWNITLIRVIRLAAFIVKIPLFLTHLWLPKAHVEAPVAGSIILAGLLLKLGSYGLLRLVNLIPLLITSVNKIFTRIRLIGAVITRIICLRQTDIKSLIAYSSVGHMGLIISGSFSNSTWGWEGSLILIIAHGICSSSIFYLAYSTYLTTKTRRLTISKGLLNFFPILTLIWFIFSSFNIAAPPSINLAGEIVLITRILRFSNLTAILLIIVSFLTAGYSLILYTSLTHGTLNFSINTLNHYSSLNYTNITLHLFPIILLILFLRIIKSWI